MAASPRPRALVFDVMGTVVDVHGGVRDATVATLGRLGVPADVAVRVSAGTEARITELMAQVNAGDTAWSGYRALRRTAARDALARLGLDPLGPADEDDLSGAVHRLEPWPDSAAGLDRLRQLVTVVALTNADPAELAGLSSHGGLAWHLALSTRPSRAYKPDPRAYAVALDALELDAGQAMKVAAHVWDLRGAAEAGFRTCYVRRHDEDAVPEPGEFELEVDDLHELAARLGAMSS